MSHAFSGVNAHTYNLDTLQDRLDWMFANARLITDWAARTTQLGPVAQQRRHNAIADMDAVCRIEREIMFLRWGE